MAKHSKPNLRHYTALCAGLTVASNAGAAVVYTAVNQTFENPDPFSDAGETTVEIDFDGIGGAEFELSAFRNRYPWSGFPSFIEFTGANAYGMSGGVGQQFIAGIEAGQADDDAPAALEAGQRIGTGGAFTTNDVLADAVWNNVTGGNFIQNPGQYYLNPEGLGEVRYLGVQFAFADTPEDVYYGWIGVEMFSGHSGRVVGYAYEDTGAAIFAGATVPIPPALPLLASGFAGLLAFRRRKEATT